jgi:hypothetical protein
MGALKGGGMSNEIVLDYEHLYFYGTEFCDDDGRGWKPIDDFCFNAEASHQSKGPLKSIPVSVVASILARGFHEVGWQGDGQITVAFLPWFIFNDAGTFWHPVFHVKQDNNGDSFLASPLPLSCVNLDCGHVMRDWRGLLRTNRWGFKDLKETRRGSLETLVNSLQPASERASGSEVAAPTETA